MDASTDEIDLGQLFRTLWRGKWLAIFFLFVSGGAGFFYASEIAPKVYVATSTVSLDNQQAQVTDFDALVGGLSAEQPSLNTEIHLIRSRQLLGRLVESEQLLDDPEFNPTLEDPSPYSVAALKALILGAEEERVYTDEELTRIAVDRLRSRLTVSNPRQSFVFEISVSAASPTKATRLANALAQTYINDQLLYKEEQSNTAIEFLADRTFELQIELNEAELAAKDFAASIDLVGPETLAAKNRQVTELRDRIEALSARQDDLNVQLGVLTVLDPGAVTEEEVSVLGNETLERAYNARSLSDDGEERFVRAINAEVDRLRSQLVQTGTQLQSLVQAVAQLDEEVARESRDLLRLQQLQREAEATSEIYGYFLTRLKEAEVQQGTQQSDARLLSPAVTPLQPSSPRVMMTAALSAILGIFLACGIVLLREMTKGGIRSAGELQSSTDISVFGQIPVAPIKKRRKLIPFLTSKNNTPFSEAVRNMRTSLLQSNPSSPPALIMVTSSIPGEGKTTCAIALAFSLSGMGKKVLLLEGDIRKNTLGQYFPDTKVRTLVLGEGDWENMELTNSTTGFDQLSLAKGAANPADLFSSSKFKDFLTSIRKSYDHVIIDVPPVLAVSDPMIIGPNVDAVLYAVAWDGTRRELVQSGLTELRNVGIVPTGLMLTKIDGAKARSYGGAARYGTYYSDYKSGYYS